MTTWVILMSLLIVIGLWAMWVVRGVRYSELEGPDAHLQQMIEREQDRQRQEILELETIIQSRGR
jgi:hypothetical protein